MVACRIVIVDDSPFSIALIKGILEEHGFEVVGEAGTLEEVKEVVQETKPALVTMDMTLPGTDGLECTRAIHEIDKNIKVIVVSSMMDEEIVKEAKLNKVSAYVQKPVDEEELVMTINRVMASEELFKFLDDEYFLVFKEALHDGMNRMTKSVLSYKEEYVSNRERESAGITIIIGIIGKYAGRMCIDMSRETAHKLSERVLKREPKDESEVAMVLAEFSNIISGNASSILNRKNKLLGLRVAPPSILRGENVRISAPGFRTSTAIATTEFGDILINVGFQRGEE